MKHLIRKIIAQLINKQSFIADYPKPGVTFLTLDALFKDPVSRKIVADAVIFAIKTESFDAVASIASRGYIFSGIITNRFADIGEHFIQKVKAKGDAHYIQTESKTEYSSDALQVLKNTIEKGKKYLLTDDLIATGGSVVAAIQLIRECGGEVDTVFVMTELLEFGARERLQKEGVNLVSLLSFTRQDLDKLLLLQKCYHDNPSTPMTYQLSRHAQGDMTLMRSSNTSKLTIQLASQSSEKKEAAQLAFQGMFDPLSIEVIGHDAESGVNCQPSEYEETRQGAGNRLKSITDNMLISDNTILVSMENGIRYSEAEKTYYDFVHVIVKKGEKTFSHTQDCCKVPAEVVNAISKDKDGHFQETWGDAALKMQLTRQPANPHQEACFGGISRTEHLRQALCKTLGKLKENMLEHSTPEMDDQQFNIKRLVDINVNKIKRKLNKKGVFFAESPQLFTGKRIDLYNQGCSKDAWGIKKEQINENKL